MKKDLTEAEVSDMLVEELGKNGYAILSNFMLPGYLRQIDADLDPVFAATPFCQGDFYGNRTKRFGSLLKRSPNVERLVLEPVILGAAETILGAACDRIQLNLAQAIEIHPGEVRQFPHRDQDMWPGPKGDHEYLINVMWPLTPFTADNGSTHIYPKSHGRDGLAKDELGPPITPAYNPGSAICFLGSTAHGAGANVTTSVRRGILISYSLGWLKPYENPWLAYPPEIARGFSPELAALAGYAQHRPNLGNYEGQCPSILLRDDIPDHIAAIDALRPDQADPVAAFAAAERNPT